MVLQLLNSPNGELWGRHVAGASRLIQLRGPARFTSEFDRALLLALGYPIVRLLLYPPSSSRRYLYLPLLLIPLLTLVTDTP